uniref:DUF2817 domain-containing protein n=1 Tax=unclassified Variovorax TaxID=663243 RepID=UPI000D369619
MPPTSTLFAASYALARRKFLAACTLLQLVPAEHRHPLAGAEGEVLATDVVRLGPAEASRVLVLTSGVHGVELFAGAGCQVDWLLHASAEDLPPDTAVLVVHAINPWGASWLRRYTEDNVDLCRNFVDYPNMPELPRAPDYAALHEAVTADPADPAAVARADQVLADHERTHGQQALYGALMGGQYDLPEGMGFGGTRPTWSRRTMEAILREHGAAARHVCLVDYHTGLGPYGYGSMVALQQHEALARIRRAFGARVEAVFEHGAPDNFAPVYGHSTPGYERALPHASVTAGVLEFGTGRPQRMLELLVRDQREWAAGTGRERIAPVRRELLDFFYPGQPEWQRSLVDQSRLIVRQALAFLAASH